MVTQQVDINFSELMDRVLALLNPKERDVIERRFSLEGKEKETLDKIGKSYDITRERVRQIEALALKKLTRISMDQSMRQVHDLAFAILEENGKVLSEDILVSQMFKNMASIKDIDANAMKLAMKVSDKLVKQEKNQFFKPFWRISEVSILQVKELVKQVKKIMKKEKDVLSIEDIAKALNNEFTGEMIESILEIEWNFKKKEDGWGLSEWRHINPKSIKDKISIIFKGKGKPLHFTEIINFVLDDFEAKKMVTAQAIHNELIRHDEFVLVGRGLYALKEWGMSAGTVCDLIVKVLEENDGPMKRQDIIQKVREKREIRIGTISLNLQKYDFFKRVGRAVYEYIPAEDNRRRRLKQLSA